eukprot:jgi/Tetstr1/458583/TSEL_044986.t1
MDGAEGGFALGDAALDELEEDQLIEEVVEGLLNDVDAANQEGEECDHENAYAYNNSEAEDNGGDEDELYFSPLPTRNPRRDTLYGHAYLVDDAKGSSGRLWAGHEKATSKHTFETWKNSTDCAMEKEQQHALGRNRPFNEIHEVHVLQSRIQPKYLESLETTLISRGIKYEDSRIVRRQEGAERLDYYRRLLDGMWEELVNITKQIERHSERYIKCHRSPGETVRDFRNLLLTHTRVKNLVTEETTRIVEISRVNVEFIARAWGKTRFSPRIIFARQQLVDYTMDTHVDMTWEMAEWLDKQERGSIHMRVHSRGQRGGGGRGFDHEEHNSRGGGRGAATTVVVEAASERVATTIDVEVEEVIVEAVARRGALTPVMKMMTCSECGKKGHIAKRCWKANPDLRPETAMAATNPREHMRVREEPKKPDRKSCMMCGRDAGHTIEECGKLRKFVANLQATDGHEPKYPQLNGYAQVVGGEEGKVVVLTAASQLRPQRKSTEAQRHGVNTPHMPLMEIAKRLVKHEPVEHGWEKHDVMRALESKRVTISLMEAYQLERSGGGMMESVMATAWGGGALSTEPISSHAQSATTSSGERAFEAALMTVEEVADQQSGGKSTAEEKTAGGEAETERLLPFTGRQQAEVVNKSIFALQPTGAEAKAQPGTARLDTITCELNAKNTLLQCETISDGGSSHTRMNASAMEPSAAEAVVKGDGGWVDVDMVLVLANGKRSCEQQRRVRDGVVFTLRDPVTSIMAAHHAPRVYENGGEAPGLLLGGPTITALGLRPDPGDRNLHFPRTQPTSRQSAAAQSNGVGAAGPRAPTCESKTCEPVDLPPLREVQGMQRHGLARLSTREEGISLYESCGGGYVAVLNAIMANGQKLEEKQPTGVGWLLENVEAYSGEGAGMLFNINTGEWERSTVHLKKELFNYEPNVIHGISLPDHERLIGNAMGLHSVAWIVGQLFVEQQRLRDLEELARAAQAAEAAQRAERER